MSRRNRKADGDKVWARVLRRVHTGTDSSAEDKVKVSSVQEEGRFERVDETDIRRLAAREEERKRDG